VTVTNLAAIVGFGGAHAGPPPRDREPGFVLAVGMTLTMLAAGAIIAGVAGIADAQDAGEERGDAPPS